MKWFGVVLFNLIVGGSLAGKCDSDLELDVALIPEQYLQTVSSIPVPTLENGDRSSAKFAQEYKDALALTNGLSVTRNIYNQAQRRGNSLINAVLQESDEIQQAIERIKQKRPAENFLDKSLQRLTNSLETFLSWKPGNVVIKQPTLPDLPKQQTEIKNRTEDHSGTDLFVHFAENFDQTVASLFGYVELLFLEGWRGVRPVLGVVQSQLRNQILNGPVMETCRQATDRIFKQRDIVQKHVENNTWVSFRNVGDRVVKISDDYWASKNDTQC